MNSAPASLPDVKPVAMWIDQGTVVTQEFISRDGVILAGYRSLPETEGFPAWERRGNIVEGFQEISRHWFPTEDAARAWALARVSGERQTASASDPA